MRSAIGCAALGLLLLVVAGTFDAEPLYVTGAALLLLGAGAAGWIGLGGVGGKPSRESSERGAGPAGWIGRGGGGAKLSREISVRSGVEDEPLQVRLEAKAGRIPLPPG